MHERRPTRLGWETRPQGVIRAHQPLRGRTSWRALDGDGQTPILVDVVDRHGHVRRTHEGRYRPNLITDAGLDFMCAEGVVAGGTPAVRHRNVLVIGTGSVEPDPTDTTLAAEAQAGATAGTGGGVSESHAAGITRLSSVVSRRVTLNANRNLTEYGFRAASGDLMIKELFRDDLNDPISLSMFSGKIIEVRHELFWDLADAGIVAEVDIQEVDATNTVVSTTTYDLEIGWMRNSGGGSSQALLGMVQPGVIQVSTTSQVWAKTTSYSMPDPFQSGSLTTLPNSVAGAFDPVAETYSSGTFARIRRWTIPITQLVGTFYGFAVSHSSANQAGAPRNSAGIGFRFDDPATFSKVNDNTLTIAFELGVGRA